MGQYKVEAILLAVRNWDDADRMVTLFSREYGKITAMAYGARRTRSPLAGAVQPFIHADLVLATGKNVESIKQCEIKQPFRILREDLIAMAYATFLGELVAELWPEREAEPAVFELLLAALGLMGSRSPRICALACAWQLLALGGFRPEFGSCTSCGQPLTFPTYFSSAAGGSVCGDCGNTGLLELSQEVSAFLDRLLRLEWSNPDHFSVTGAVLMQTERLLADFIGYRLDKSLKSMAFIASVTELDNNASLRIK